MKVGDNEVSVPRSPPEPAVMLADMAQLIEPSIPALRRYARPLLHDAAAADDATPAGGNAYQWVFSSGGSGSFQNLAVGPALSQLAFGDFNADRITDVFAAACN